MRLFDPQQRIKITTSNQRHGRVSRETGQRRTSDGELSQEFLLVHVILERLAAVDEHYRDFIVEPSAEFEVRVDIDFAPGEPSAARELRQALLHHFTKMTSFTGIDDNAAGLQHA
jgi:hypothetical protein